MTLPPEHELVQSEPPPARPRRPRRTTVAVIGALVVTVLVAAVLIVDRSGHEDSRGPGGYSIFGDTVPAVPSVDDDRSVELGVRFTTADVGWVTSLRFYRGALNTGEHVGSLWGPGGELLARATFATADVTGWQQAQLDRPVEVSAGSVYTASYRAPAGHYATDAPSSTPPRPVTHGALTALQGVYSYEGGVPEDTFGGIYYYVDVVFTTSRPSGEVVVPQPVASSGAGSTPTSTPSTSSGSAAVPTTSASDRPGATSTGVPEGTDLTPYRGPLVITKAGTVIDAQDVTGALVVRARDVVISRSRIHGDLAAVAGVFVDEGGSATITDSEIFDVQVGISYGSWTALRVDVHDTTSDGVKISSHVRLQDSWIHDGKPGPGAHWDGAQVQDGVTDSVVSGSFIDATGPGTNSALFLAPDLGPSSDGPLSIIGNWLDGGNYTIYVLDGDNGRFFIRDILVGDNRFGRTSRYGPADVTVPVSWSGNVWEDTGETLAR